MADNDYEREREERIARNKAMLGESLRMVISLSTGGILMSSLAASCPMHSSGALACEPTGLLSFLHPMHPCHPLLLVVIGCGRAAAGGWHLSVHGSGSQERCGPQAESPREEQRGARDCHAVPSVVQVWYCSPRCHPSFLTTHAFVPALLFTCHVANSWAFRRSEAAATRLKIKASVPAGGSSSDDDDDDDDDDDGDDDDEEGERPPSSRKRRKADLV